MEIQRLSKPNLIFSQLILSPSHIFYPSSSSPKQNPTKLELNQYSKSGFCNSLKRVSKSVIIKRNCRGGGGIRCGMEQGNDKDRGFYMMEQGNDKDDGFYMSRCVELARKAIGCTSPNPMVGCVIVKDGKVVGEGFHPRAGQPHGEVFALREAGESAEDATAYVSLEPCNHYGRTPPCTEALIKAKVKKVVVGMVDPNPIVDSKGLERLRDAGIDVIVGVEEELCKRLNEAFIHRILTRKPFVTLRYSLSVNGHLLDQLGDGVTESGGYYSQLLQEYDAVIQSASLTRKHAIPASQEPGANQPFQIITASNPGSPIQIPGLSEETASKVIIFTDKETTVEPELGKKGIETVVLDQMNLNAILDYCYSRGFCSVFLDLRGNYGDLDMLFQEGIEQKLLQKVVVEILPIWSESNSGNPHALLNSLGKGLKMKNLQSSISGQTVVLEGYF